LNEIKSIEWLKNHFRDEHLVVIDCRFSLGDPDYGRRVYEEGHIPEAIFFDLEKDLSNPPQQHGGRHPLPDLHRFIEKCQAAGIDDQSTIVVYDDGEGSFASRFWWLLTFLNHPHVYILDGGYTGWKEAQLPTTTDIPSPVKTNYRPEPNDEMIVSYEDVKQAVAKKDRILIDSRAKNRYLGIVEPIDRVPGHIPGAINIEWTDSLKNGLWQPLEKQQERFQHLDKNEEIIVYCGSGVTATPNFLALKAAGFRNVKLYPGSYSDWVSYEENPVEKGES